MMADLNGSNVLQTRYLHGDQIDQLIARVVTSGSTPAPSWYLPDRLGSIRNITDANGNLIDTITYDGFGNVTNETNSAAGDRWKFTGRELDSETGLQFNRALQDPDIPMAGESLHGSDVSARQVQGLGDGRMTQTVGPYLKTEPAA
jgi:hypothetical protein